ncbi:hypothetical protein HERIO_1619 [Hepatospora eriocheir]|uniref:C3H1-type domain-containing protein n=1 Tax=Hepatospora eriocheir TaxID=1081669 RepID=A0A1X0Q9J4_9MICR|nr:hypothetical protein HERIO_1619 [Hepatospora eriocheir]
MLEKQKVETVFKLAFVKKFTKLIDQKTMPKLHQPLFKNALCKFYVHNQCNRGNECSFSHKLSDFTDEQILMLVESPLYDSDTTKV